MSKKKYPEIFAKWNLNGNIKCEVCKKRAAYIKKYQMCRWCYTQYKIFHEFDDPKWNIYFQQKAF